VRAHAATIMLARTWLQPGPPTTLGLKLAGTLAALRRSKTRLRAAQLHAIVLQFGGAVGTLSALGDKGEAVSQSLADKLELLEATIPWHTQRDNIAEVAASLSILLGTLGKLASDIALLTQAEVGEVSEASREGKGSSSTMPHKHNPVACAAILAAAKQAPGLTATLLGAMIQEHERGLGSWQAEWSVLPELFCVADGVLAHAIDLVENLVVHPDRMRANIAATHGMPLAEAVSVALARKIGRPQANALLRIAVENASAQQSTLAAALKAMPEVGAHLSDEEIDALLNPDDYLGSAKRFIRQVSGDANS
jgi:3-carboxy-cis,cis-muconate cycloisomerase